MRFIKKRHITHKEPDESNRPKYLLMLGQSISHQESYLLNSLITNKKDRECVNTLYPKTNQPFPNNDQLAIFIRKI